jgi:type VI secretion system protein VasG
MLRPELAKHFKPAFLGRLKVVPYFPITDENLRIIVRLKLNKVAERMLENRRTAFSYDDDVVAAIANRCTEVDSGARNIDHILTNTLLPEMSKELLSRMVNEEQVKEVRVTLDGEGQFMFAIE